MQTFAQNFTQQLNIKIYTSSSRFIELYLKMTKLCCLNQHNPSPHFSAFHAELAATASELSQVYWNSPDLNPLDPLAHLDYHVWVACWKSTVNFSQSLRRLLS